MALKEISIPILRFFHILSTAVVFSAAWYEFIFISDRSTLYYPIFWTSLAIAALTGSVLYLWEYLAERIFNEDNARGYQAMIRLKWLLAVALGVLSIVLKVENASVACTFITFGIVCLSVTMNVYRGWHAQLEDEIYAKHQDDQPAQENSKIDNQ